jgi:[ribosomal protein S5]-alanine N-acetyltransferase
MMLPVFNPFPILQTERLKLRRIEMTDAPEIFNLRRDEKLMQYIDRPLAQSEDDARALIEKIDTAVNRNDGITWGITLKNTNLVVGTLGFWRLDKENYRAEIGYMLHGDLQGRGLMKEALQVMLEYGFTTMKLHSVEANTNPNNKASQALLHHFGFKQEAYFRENYYYNGHFLDSAIFSLLVHEFIKQE